jgi:hypothetical protein
MFKTLWFIKRKPGLTREQFKEHYENRHVPLGEHIIRGMALNYVRFYLHPIDPDGPEPVYDAVMEMSFPDRATFDAMNAKLLADRDFVRVLVEDEARFIDREAAVHYCVEEIASDLGS